MTLVDRILAGLFAPKSGVYSVLKVQEREDACSQLLWAHLGCLAVAQDYLKFELAKASKEMINIKSKADTASGKVTEMGIDLKKLVARVTAL